LFRILGVSFILFTGCAFKADEAPTENKVTSESHDLDGDGIEDSSDPRPFEADFPRPSIHSFIEGIITLYQSGANGSILKKEFSFGGLGPEDLANTRIKFLSQYFSKMKNHREENPSLDGSLLNIYPLKSLSTENQFKLEDLFGEMINEEELHIDFDLKFTLNFQEVSGVLSVGRIRIAPLLISPTLEEFLLGDFLLLEGINRPLEVNFPGGANDFKYTKTVGLKFVLNNKSSEVLKKLANGFVLALKVENYSFDRNGTAFIFSDMLSQIEHQTALLVELSPVNFKYNYFVPQNAYPLNPIDLTNTGFINSYLGLGNTLEKDPSIDALSINDFKKGSWFVLGDRDNLKTLTNPSEKIALTYLTGADLTKSTFTEKKLLDHAEIASELSLSGLTPGESYQFVITGTSLTPQISPPNSLRVEGGANRRICTTDPPFKIIRSCEEIFYWGEWCEISETEAIGPKVDQIIFNLEQFPKIYLDNELVKVDSFPSNDGKKLRFKIDIPTEEKIIKNLKVVLPDKKSMANLTYGFVGYTNCPARNKPGFCFKNYSTAPHTISGDIHFQYQATVTKWGKNH
jgi:hypothetical protein